MKNGRDLVPPMPPVALIDAVAEAVRIMFPAAVQSGIMDFQRGCRERVRGGIIRADRHDIRRRRKGP